MIFPILSGLAICLFSLPVIWNGIAGRVYFRRKLFVSNQQAIVQVAEQMWRNYQLQSDVQYDVPAIYRRDPNRFELR